MGDHVMFQVSWPDKPVEYHTVKALTWKVRARRAAKRPVVFFWKEVCDNKIADAPPFKVVHRNSRYEVWQHRIKLREFNTIDECVKMISEHKRYKKP